MEQYELQREREKRIKERNSRTMAEVHRQHVEYMEELERKELEGFIDHRASKGYVPEVDVSSAGL